MIHEVRVSIIAAMDEKRGIGKNNDLLFKIPRDFERLKDKIREHALVMGSNTFLSLPKKIPGSAHIVVTKNPSRFAELGENKRPDYLVHSLIEGVNKGKELEMNRHSDNVKEPEVFIFGGGTVYEEAVEKMIPDRLYLTLVEGDYGAEVFFPDYSKYTKVISEEKYEEDGFKFRFLDLEKRD